MLHSDFLGLYMMPFCLFQDPTLHLVVVSLGFFRLWQFLRFSLVLMTLTVWRSAARVLCRMSLSWDLSGVFLMVRLGLWVLERKSLEVKCHFCITSHRGYILSTWLISVDVDLGHLAGGWLSGFSIAVTLLPPSHTVPLGRKSLCTAHT